MEVKQGKGSMLDYTILDMKQETGTCIGQKTYKCVTDNVHNSVKRSGRDPVTLLNMVLSFVHIHNIHEKKLVQK